MMLSLPAKDVESCLNLYKFYMLKQQKQNLRKEAIKQLTESNFTKTVKKIFGIKSKTISEKDIHKKIHEIYNEYTNDKISINYKLYLWKNIYAPYLWVKNDIEKLMFMAKHNDPVIVDEKYLYIFMKCESLRSNNESNTNFYKL